MLSLQVLHAHAQLLDRTENGLFDGPFVDPEFCRDLRAAPLLQMLENEAHALKLRQSSEGVGKIALQLMFFKRSMGCCEIAFDIGLERLKHTRSVLTYLIQGRIDGNAVYPGIQSCCLLKLVAFVPRTEEGVLHGICRHIRIARNLEAGGVPTIRSCRDRLVKVRLRRHGADLYYCHH